MTTRRLVLGLVLLGGLPAALGSGPGEFALATAGAHALAGDVVVRFGGGGAFVHDADAAGVLRLSGLTGRVDVWSWEEVVTHGAASRRTVGEPTLRSFEVREADLVLRLEREEFALRAVSRAEGGVEVAGPLDSAGRAAALAAPVREGGASAAVGPFEPAPELLLDWPAGWAYVGASTVPPLDAWPDLGGGALALRGPFGLRVAGGEVSFTDADGAAHTVGLRREPTAGTPPALPAGATHQRAHRLLFLGDIAGARVPLAGADSWAAAGPQAVWDVRGDATFPSATGWVADGDGRRAVQDVTVLLRGETSFRSEGTLAVAAVGRTDHRGAGAFEAFVDDAPLGGRAAAPLGGLAVAAGSALGGLLAWRSALGLYTRLRADRLLDHPTRKALHDAVLAEPGVHARDLHRRVGGAWGPFAFHLRTLAAARYLRLERRGRYLHAFPAGDEGRRLAAPPVARRIYEALPADGTPIPFADLVSRIAVKRQLVDHHVRALAERGHVHVAWRGRSRLVSRAPPPADPS